MHKPQNTPRKYGKNYFINDFPPNHNALIGPTRDDTLSNVRASLSVLRNLAEVPDFSITEYTPTGFHFLTTCMIDALSFELNHRA